MCGLDRSFRSSVHHARPLYVGLIMTLIYALNFAITAAESQVGFF